MSKSKHTEAQIIAVLKKVEADLTGGRSWPASFLCGLCFAQRVGVRRRPCRRLAIARGGYIQ